MADINDFLARVAQARREDMAIVDGTIRNVRYVDKKAAKNWIARVTRNLAGGVGGLDRSFFAHGPGDRAFVPSDLAAGDYLEFGGDKLSSGGSRRFMRDYMQVMEVHADRVVVRPVAFGDIGEAAAHNGGEPTAPVEVNALGLGGVSDEDLWAEVCRRGLNRGPMHEADAS